MPLSYELLKKIQNEHGSSFYIFDRAAFTQNYHNLLACFRSHYRATEIAYSYKTNYIPRICSTVHSLGGFAEVVSNMELSLALQVGVPPERIFFNGPYKEPRESIKLLSAGGIVNIDSMNELIDLVQEGGLDQSKPLRIGIRCNFNITEGSVSRFGFDVGDQSFDDAIELIDQTPGFELVGLHCHFAPRNLACWRDRTQCMIDLIQRKFGNRLQDLRFVSLGGGLYGPMSAHLSSQFDIYTPTFEEYAEVAAGPFSRYFRSKDHQPTLIIEPGTALVADTLSFVCGVISLKNIRGSTFISTNGSVFNINPGRSKKYGKIDVFPVPNSHDRWIVEGAKVCGYTCIEDDYLYEGFEGPISVGDFIVFNEIGSYSVVMKPPFILPNVAIIELDQNQMGFSLLKRAESFGDVFHTYGIT